MISTMMKAIIDDESGATAIEYGLIVALIAVAIIGSLAALAGETSELWNGNERGVTQAIGDGATTPPED
jgi:pilus assembly protein Flp/PilA